MDLLLAILQPIKAAALTISPLLLNLLYGLVLLLIGLLIAKGLQWIVVKVLGLFKLDKGLKKIGFTNLLANGGIKSGPTLLLGDLIYWLTIFVTVTAVAKVLGLAPAGTLLAGLLAYLPAVLSAAYILGVGIFVAILVAGVVSVIVGNLGLSHAGSLAKIVQYAVVIFAFIAALGQLGISVSLMAGSISLIGGAIALAAAIAFGLGAKDLAGKFLDKFFE
jgi:hypothetical protein